MNILCPINAPCIDDASALGNFSSEAPDKELFRSYYFPNQIWDGNSKRFWYACGGFCVSEISQADADLCAHNNAKICERLQQYLNIEWTCQRICADGTLVSYTVPAGTFWGYTQAQANALAAAWCQSFLDQSCDSIPGGGGGPGGTVSGDHDDGGERRRPPPPDGRYPRTNGLNACNDAQNVETVCYMGTRGYTIRDCMVWGSSVEDANARAYELAQRSLSLVGCLTSLPLSVCRGEDIGRWTVVADQMRVVVPPFTWEIFGILDPGLTMVPTYPDSPALWITGSFTTAGNHTFRLTLTDKFGTFSSRVYHIQAMQFLTADPLPDGTEDAPYSASIALEQGIPPYRYVLNPFSAPLPPGLTLHLDGTIDGTPTAAGTYTFDVIGADSKNASCEEDYTITINPNLFDSIPWVLTTSTVPPGTASAIGGGESVQLAVDIPGGGGSGTARASFHSFDGNPPWNIVNPGAALNCRVTLTVDLAGWPPPGIQIGSAGFTFQRTLPGPMTIIFTGAGQPTGVYTADFVIPSGNSRFEGRWLDAASASGPPFGGHQYWTITFSYL